MFSPPRTAARPFPPLTSPFVLLALARAVQVALIGALLSPTDPVLTSSIVTNPRIPRVVRHSLNLESGLNDGLALPAVLANREGKSANLVTDQEYADSEIYVEFAIPRNSNSGVCVMGNYEIQLYDSAGKPDN